MALCTVFLEVAVPTAIWEHCEDTVKQLGGGASLGMPHTALH
jgi:hypothetical protein